MIYKFTRLLGFIKNTLNKVIFFINSSLTLSTLLVFTFFTFLFLSVYMSLPIVSGPDDHYFHFKFASRLLNSGFMHSFRDFKTIYFTGVAHGQHLLYYVFLFYAVLIPFTFLTPLYLGIKLFAIFSVSLIGTVIYFILRKLNIKYAFLWAIGFFSFIGMGAFWRLFLSRPFVLSPLIILLLLLAIHKRKYMWIFILSFIPLFWHTATFFVPLLVGGLYFLCYGFYYRKYLWRELGLVFAGVLAAVGVATIVDPGFYISIRDNLFSVLSGILDTSATKINISEGNEVYPKNFFDLFNNNILLCSMFVMSMVFYVLTFLKDIKKVLFFDENTKNKKVLIMVFFAMSSVFIAAIPNISGRFADFFIFFGWIFFVLIANDIFSYIEFSDVDIKKYVGYSVLVCILYLFLNTNLQLNDFFSTNSSKPETFKEVGEYLAKNLNKGEVVYDVNWSFFPQLYYYAPDQNYAIGLEPKLTYLYSPRLYWLWANISAGYVCEVEKCPEIEKDSNAKIRDKTEYSNWTKSNGNKIADVIINDFQSHYIVTSSSYNVLNFTLNNSKRFERVVNSNDKYFVYKVLDLKK